jgi:hypothetical protein
LRLLASRLAPGSEAERLLADARNELAAALKELPTESPAPDCAASATASRRSAAGSKSQAHQASAPRCEPRSRSTRMAQPTRRG